MPRKKNVEELPQESEMLIAEGIERMDHPSEETGVEPAVEGAHSTSQEASESTDAVGEEAQDLDSIPELTGNETSEILSVELEGGISEETADLLSQSEDTEDLLDGLSAEGQSLGETALAVPAKPDAVAEQTALESAEGNTRAEPVSVNAGESAASNERNTESISPEKTPEEERRAFYDLNFNELDRNLTPEQRQEWNSVYASYRGHTAMRGTVVGLDRLRLRVRDRNTGEMTWHRLYCAIVIPFRVRILIPETEMWMQGEERPSFVLRNIPGAVIDFVIIHVDREAGFAVGSRRLALPSRRYYFSTQPRMNAAGSRVTCDVLVVGPRRCLVSCNGYDMNLTQRELSYTAIADLREVYHSGQTLNCVVKDYDREANRLIISIKESVPNPFDGAEFRHPVQSHRQGVISGKYGGGVFCNLADGVTVMCNYSFHYDDSSFSIGDRVMLIIQRYDDSKKQIYGKIVAKS